MGELERRVLQQGWCPLSEYQQLKNLTWYDKMVLWLKQQANTIMKRGNNE